MENYSWSQHCHALHVLLKRLAWFDLSGVEVHSDAAFEMLCQYAIEARKHKKTTYLIGNGASASMASHFAADLAKNAELHTEVFTDSSMITAIANDMGYEHVFSEPLARRATQGDMLIAISSSGASPNILKAVEVARALDVYVVTLSAMDSQNPLRFMGNLNAYIAASTYGPAETCHAAILHYWMDLVDNTRDASDGFV